MHKNLTIDKLLQNDDFIQWIVGGNTDSLMNWDEIINEASLEDKKVYSEAQKILKKLLALDVEGHIEKKSDTFIDSSYVKLLENYASQKTEKKVFSLNSVLKYAAAILLPVAIATLVYNYQSSTNIFEDHLLAEQYNPEKIQIRTNDGKYYSVDGVKGTSWITSNGLFVSVSREELEVRKADDFKADKRDMYTVLVPKGQRYEVALEDGTNVELNSASQLAFNISDSKYRNVSLDGEAYFDVAKDKNRPFVVKTKRMDIEVLGTEFNVSTYSSPNYYSTTLVEGSIQVTTPNGGKRLIEPSEQARILLDDYKIEVHQADVQDVVAWTSGRMIFRNETLEQLATKLSRWYDVEFIVDDELKDIQFNGTLSKDKKLLHVLQMLKYTEGVDYKIRKDTIKLYKD
ncbi:MAG: FecR domain-containing protein [Bacteroidota bacterium]